MTALEQALELQNQAIQLLLTEREEIDHRLLQLGHGQEKTTQTKRGRPRKLDISHGCSTLISKGDDKEVCNLP